MRLCMSIKVSSTIPWGTEDEEGTKLLISSPGCGQQIIYENENGLFVPQSLNILSYVVEIKTM